MSLNALGVSQLARPALSSAGAGTTFSLGAGSYAGLTPANYDVVVGTTGAFVAGVSTVNLSILNVTSVAQAAGCIVECFLQVPLVPQPPIAAAVVQGVKYGGTVVYTAGAPDTAIMNLYALAADGSVLATFVGTCGFRVYIPRVGFF
jgi:hypothetical protein